jgi:hypothetical protein
MRLNQIDGLPIFDAKKAISLTINAKDVDRADPKRPDNCAVAIACRRQTHAKEVRVHLGRVYVRANDLNWQRYITPRPMRAEIIAFDRGGEFEPGTFTLSAPQPTKRVTGKRQGTSRQRVAKGVTGGKKRAAYHVVKNVRTGPA